MTNNLKQIIEKERLDCEKMRVKLIENTSDLSSLVTEITNRAKIEAKSHADEYL